MSRRGPRNDGPTATKTSEAETIAPSERTGVLHSSLTVVKLKTANAAQIKPAGQTRSFLGNTARNSAQIETTTDSWMKRPAGSPR